MTDLPATINPGHLATYLGPKSGSQPHIPVRPGTTVASFGDGAVPIEPPITLPAGGTVVMGDSQRDCIFHGLAVYVDGQRTAMYRFTSGRFIRDGETS